MPNAITESEILDRLNAAWSRMTRRQQLLWEAIRIDPEKWQLEPYGDSIGGFWAVALLGRVVVWYNEIEDGFNRSRYTSYGLIDEYWCNQDDLALTVQQILNDLEPTLNSLARH